MGWPRRLACHAACLTGVATPTPRIPSGNRLQTAVKVVKRQQAAQAAARAQEEAENPTRRLEFEQASSGWGAPCSGPRVMVRLLSSTAGGAATARCCSIHSRLQNLSRTPQLVPAG